MAHHAPEHGLDRVYREETRDNEDEGDAEQHDSHVAGETSGKGDRSGTPLAWTHGAFVRLAWSLDAGEPAERPSIVACRYTKEDCAR